MLAGQWDSGRVHGGCRRRRYHLRNGFTLSKADGETTVSRECVRSTLFALFHRFATLHWIVRFPDRMPCSDAEKLALKAFLGQKRGMRKLISSTHPGRRGCGMCARAGACGCLAVCVWC